MANLGSLIISLEANTAKFTDALTKAEHTAKQRSDNIIKHMSGIGAAIAGMVSVAALEGMFMSVIAMESKLVKLAIRLNTTAETLASLGGIARDAGMDIDSFGMALTRMEKNLSTAVLGVETSSGKLDENGEVIISSTRAWDQLGIKVAEFQKLKLDQQLKVMSDQMRANIDPADRVAVALQIFGKTGAGMVYPLSKGGEALQKLIDREKELNPLTNEMAAGGAKAKTAISQLGVAWDGFATNLVAKVAPAITTITNKLTELTVALRQSQNELTTSNMMNIVKEIHQGHTAVGESGKGMGATGGGGWGTISEDVKKPPIRPAAPAAKAKDMGLDRMSTIIDTLTKDLAKLTEGSLAEIMAWGTHMRSEIGKVGAKGADMEVALGLQKKLETAKKIKAEEDYGLFVAKESGDTYAIIDAQGKADLEKYKGFATAKAVTDAATARKKLEEQAKNNEEVWGLQKNVLDSLASLTPVISEQNFLKKKSLDLEILITKSTLDQKLAKLELSHVISKAQADEFRGLQAIEAQAKRTNLAMEQDKGIKGWAFERNKSVSQQSTIKDMMSGAESFMTNAFSSGIQGVLSKDKKSLKDIGKTMFDGFLGEIHKGSITKSFDALAKIISPAKGLGKDGKDDGGLGQAAGLLSGAGLQLGLSAGGLALSGIGIMTNSQALVYAGTVLQIAGLAIQIYEALAATTTAMTMTVAATALTGSAVALTSAATMLMFAAAVDAIPFFHSGGIITAHQGWAKDDVLIRAQTGERVLSRAQNRDYEAGKAAGGGGRPLSLSISIDARGAQKGIDWKRITKTQIAPEIQKLINLNRLRTA